MSCLPSRVKKGANDWWTGAATPIDLAVPPAGVDVRVFASGNAGEQLGSALALVDIDGDGRLEIVAGAPGYMAGAGAVHVLALADLVALPSATDAGAPVDAGTPAARVPRLVGRAGSSLGVAVGASHDLVAVGAPLVAAEQRPVCHRLGGHLVHGPPSRGAVHTRSPCMRRAIARAR